MKKYIILILLTVLSVMLCVQIPNIAETFSAPCSTASVVIGQAHQSVFCKGILEYSELCELTADRESRIGSVFVKPGEYVFSGKPVCQSEPLCAMEPSYSGEAAEPFIMPENGFIADVPVETGEKIQAGESILHYYKGSGFVVKMQISEEDIADIEIGQKVLLHCSALKDEVLEGTLTELSENAYQTTYATSKITVVDAVVSISEYNSKLKPGYSITAEIVLSETENAVILPFDAVAQDAGGEYYIYRVTNGWAVKEYIEVCFEDERGVVVNALSGLDGICENPEQFRHDRVRVQYGND